jgi:hypothetical protein
VALAGGVLGAQVAAGGGDFVPARARNPCVARSVAVVSDGVQALGERLVLIGLDGAACSLGVTREALILDLAGGGRPSDAQVTALHGGLLGAVNRLSEDGALPTASALAEEVVATADLPWYVEQGIRLLPDAVIDGVVKTDDVLRRTVDGLDLRQLLANTGDPDALTDQLDAAVSKAVQESVIARLKDLLPG